MRVLWFSMIPSLFSQYSNSHNGGGWISSLERIVRSNQNINLGVAFYSGHEYKEIEKDGVNYYLLPNDNRNMFIKVLAPERQEQRISKYLRVINDFKPDIIQIFGSENDFGLICDKVDIPVVIHIQGSMPPYHNALFPVGMNQYDFIFGRGLTRQRRFMGWRSEKSFRAKATREIGILKSCNNFMGRTDWDRNIVGLYNPEAKYFHCEEALRDSFISSGKTWGYKQSEKIKLVSVISNPWYKGADLILKTAKLLKECTELNFEWNVYGTSDVRFYESKYGIKAHDVNVNIKGSVSKDELVNSLCDSSIYIHSSYIDNSPNSLCEAQYLGLPVLATNVGGISSIVKDKENGILFPANDPYTLAALIKRLVQEPDLCIELSKNARAAAVRRHNPDAIGENIVEIYNQICKKQ